MLCSHTLRMQAASAAAPWWKSEWRGVARASVGFAQWICIGFVLALTACTMEHLPRNMKLKAFDPHRADFVCVQADAKAPALRPEAQALHEEAMALTSPALWPNERNWPRAMQLWQQATEMGHWKAAMMWVQTAQNGAGLNSVKGQFAVPRQDSEEVVKQVEQMMRQGVADGFYLMGRFHDTGYGVKRNVDRAWALWELAADLGSARAQTQIAKVLNAASDDPKGAWWGNKKIALKMLECSYAQGYGAAAYELGSTLNRAASHGRNPDLTPISDANSQFTRALRILHDAVKFGSEDAAGSLLTAFDDGSPLVKGMVDKARAERYGAIGDALFNNPDLRFPNLDKVLPLTPAKLPKWDGKPDTLINAAKGVRVTPQQQDSSASQCPTTHRAYVPPSAMLEVPNHLARMPVLPGFTNVLAERPGSTGLARAQIAGYWQAKLVPVTPNESSFVASLRRDLSNLPPLRFEEGERMQLTRGNSNLPHEDQTHYLVEWHFAGRPVPMQTPQDWLAKAGTVRTIEAATDLYCTGEKHCPATGIWQPQLLDAQHPLHAQTGIAMFSEAWKWQAFVQAGQSMPSLQQLGLPLEDPQVHWRLMQATELGFAV